MANRRISVTIDFNGPSPITGTNNSDKRVSMVNVARLLRGADHGAQYRPTQSTQVTVNQSVVQATGTITPAAVQAADTASVGGQALTATKGRATGTVTAATVLAGDTFTLNGQLFTGVAGAAVPGEATFSVDTGNNAVAADIVAQVNAYGGAKISGVVAAKAASAVVTFYAANEGTTGNAIALASSDGATLAVSGAALTGGAALTNNQFDYAGSNATTGASLARAITNSTTAAVKQVTAAASATTGVVTVTAKAPGAAGNAVALASSNGGRLAVSAATLTSGSQGASTVWSF